MATDCEPDTDPDAAAPVVARRGTKWLTRGELEAHLAAVSRLENVGILLGSGASVGVGGLTISQLWQQFSTAHAASVDWLVDKRFMVRPTDPPPNIESLADSLEIARIEWTRSTHNDLPDLTRHQIALCRSIIDAAVLQPDWWSNPASVLDFPDPLASHRQILHKLTGARQPGQCAPWVFTSNYDLAIEWAAESLGLQVQNGFGGLHARSFSPHNFDLAYRNANAHGEAQFGTYNIYLAKLHGSLTWRVVDGNLVVEDPATLAWSRIDAYRLGQSNDLGGYVVLPSAAKYLQTVGFVLGELFRRLTDFLARPQTCLIISGYSFADEHLNRVILSALQNPTLHIIAYLPELQKNGTSFVVPEGRPWLSRLCSIASPQVTLVGGGESAWFSALANDLPDPALYDAQAAEIRRLLKDLREFHNADRPSS